jgi:hypothetical protein
MIIVPFILVLQLSCQVVVTILPLDFIAVFAFLGQMPHPKSLQNLQTVQFLQQKSSRTAAQIADIFFICSSLRRQLAKTIHTLSVYTITFAR